MKVGIVTQPLLGNYGGILQNYALQQTLRKLGHTPQTIDYIMTNSAWRYFRHTCKYHLRKILGKTSCNEQAPTRLRLRTSHMDEFVKQHIATTEPTTKYLAQTIVTHKMEAIVVGSDQVWRPKYNDRIEDMYLDFAIKANIKRIAYAASFGVDKWEYGNSQSKRCRSLAKLFDAISVREKSGEKLCREHLDTEATTVLDPTLLLNAEDWNKLCKDIPRQEKPILAVYLLKSHNKQHVQNNLRFIQKMASEKNLEIKFFTADTAGSISIEEWLATFRDAKMVITDSFHGTVFSILNHRDFLTLGNPSRGMARLNTLLNELGIENRLISPSDYNAEDIKPLDYSQVEIRLAALRDHSLHFLRKALNGED